MINNWLISLIGNIGTTFLVLGAFIAYIIWQFNPVIRLPKKSQPITTGSEEQTSQGEFILQGQTINDIYAEKKGNSLKGDARLPDGQAKLFIVKGEHDAPYILNDLKIVEKDEQEAEAQQAFEDPVVAKEVVADLLSELGLGRQVGLRPRVGADGELDRLHFAVHGQPGHGEQVRDAANAQGHPLQRFLHPLALDQGRHPPLRPVGTRASRRGPRPQNRQSRGRP